VLAVVGVATVVGVVAGPDGWVVVEPLEAALDVAGELVGALAELLVAVALVAEFAAAVFAAGSAGAVAAVGADAAFVAVGATGAAPVVGVTEVEPDPPWPKSARGAPPPWVNECDPLPDPVVAPVVGVAAGAVPVVPAVGAAGEEPVIGAVDGVVAGCPFAPAE
jgi:hypothetical protein